VTKPIVPVDPMDGIDKIVELSRPQSILANEPLNSWLVEMGQLKARLGGVLPWAEIFGRMVSSAGDVGKLALAGEVPTARIDGKVRKLTDKEVAACVRLSNRPLTHRVYKTYLASHHAQLWADIKDASNGRGSGVRCDES